ncbi:MAG: integral rane sensor signal transduction histidine kinase [Chloroflexi bacterium]|nr:integral rane sensor signal transduction histidine kinase [Chloroflexota bacterium]
MMTPAMGRAERPAELRALGPLAAGSLVAAIAVALAIVVARFWLGLPAEHVKNLARFLLISGGVSLLVTLSAAWLMLHRTRGRLALKLGVVCSIGPIVAAINTYYTADTMLIRQNDFGLLILLLAFSGTVGIAFALALARTLTARIGRLAHAAQRLGSGPAAVRVPEGVDEIGELGRTFNQLAVRLQESDARRNELEEARRMLLAAISHDLRTPLTSLRAVVEALSDGIVQDQQTASRYLVSARQQVRQMETLIEDLFELARLDAGALELHRSATTVATLVDEAVESLRVQAEHGGIQLVVHLAQDLPSISVDGQRIGRVLLNILGNAILFTPSGGQITVLAVSERGTVRISVRDTGAGIDDDDLPHVFESFYRGEKSRSRRHGGAGLGLAIARGLVEAHGGRIWADSESGSGTSISFTLPSSETVMATAQSTI